MLNLTDHDRRVRRALQDAVHNSPIRGEAIAAEVGMSRSHFYNSINPLPSPENVSRLCVHRFERVVELTADAGPLAIISMRLGYTLMKIQREIVTEADLRERYMRIAKEFGDVAREINRALADAVVTPGEWDRIEQEIGEMVARASEVARPQNGAKPKIQAVK